MKLTFLKTLATLFIGLKLTEQINWTWWWVLSPLWVEVCIKILWVLLLDWALKQKEAREGEQS
jgi:hypothetical protein